MSKAIQQASPGIIDLSVVIISYNTLEFTRACLESVFSAPGNLSVEVIVVDNASQDGSVEMVIEQYPSARLIQNNNNVGFAVANNQAFILARGDFILLLNSDTVVLGDVLQKSVDYLRAHLKVGAMGCRVLNTDRTMQPTCSGYPSISRLFLMTIGLDRLPIFSMLDRYLMHRWGRDDERNVDVISGCYLMVRREVIEAVGGLDESFFFFGEETDWCLQIRRAGWELKFAPIGEIIHHGGGSVKKLNYRRDVMLTEAIVRLHKKNGSTLAAVMTFVILAIFNLSRALIWTIFSFIQSKYQSRAAHFRQVTAHILDTWPKVKRVNKR